MKCEEDFFEITNLDNYKKIYQYKNGFKFSHDAVELSKFIKLNKKSKIVEIGTGNAIIPILLFNNSNTKYIDTYDALDIQSENINISTRNIYLNKLDNYINLINIDVNDYIKSNFYDIVISNPPYIELDGKKQNENLHKLISRHEVKLDLENFIKNSKRLLKPIGTLFFVHRAHRLVEIIRILDKYKFCVARICFVKKNNDYLNLILIEAYKGKKTKLKIENRQI